MVARKRFARRRKSTNELHSVMNKRTGLTDDQCQKKRQKTFDRTSGVSTSSSEPRRKAFSVPTSDPNLFSSLHKPYVSATPMSSDIASNKAHESRSLRSPHKVGSNRHLQSSILAAHPIAQATTAKISPNIIVSTSVPSQAPVLPTVPPEPKPERIRNTAPSLPSPPAIPIFPTTPQFCTTCGKPADSIVNLAPPPHGAVASCCERTSCATKLLKSFHRYVVVYLAVAQRRSATEMETCRRAIVGRGGRYVESVDLAECLNHLALVREKYPKQEQKRAIKYVAVIQPNRFPSWDKYDLGWVLIHQMDAVVIPGWLSSSILAGRPLDFKNFPFSIADPPPRAAIPHIMGRSGKLPVMASVNKRFSNGQELREIKMDLRTFLCTQHILAGEKKNVHLVKILKELAEYEKAVDDEVAKYNAAPRYLVLQLSAALLKCCKRHIQKVEDLDADPVLRNYLGASTRRKLREIIQTGTCQELEAHRRDLIVRDGSGRIRDVRGARVKAELRKVIGITRAAGPLYDSKYTSVSQLQKGVKHGDKRLFEILNGFGGPSKTWEFGLRYYQDTSCPLPLREVEEMRRCIEKELDLFSQNNSKFERSRFGLYQVGGARRGEGSGHDADFIITHPKIGVTGEGSQVLKSVVVGMVQNGRLFGKEEKIGFHMFQSGRITSRKNGTYINASHIERLKTAVHTTAVGFKNLAQDQYDRVFGAFRTSEDKVRRIDIIVVPYIEMPFALLSWTGNVLFNRNLRQYCKDRGLYLTYVPSPQFVHLIPLYVFYQCALPPHYSSSARVRTTACSL
ncbi:hypothetical protein AAMO2058_000111100 [Amorphochlora amoebiformis]